MYNETITSRNAKEELLPISVNLVLTDRCNYKCAFCFGKYEEGRFFENNRVLEIPCILKKLGTKKLTIEGGEPFLRPKLLKSILMESKKCGLTTMVISNGSLITKDLLIELAPYLDWLGLSIDSSNEEVEIKLGRGFGNHLSKVKDVARWTHELSINLKINVVVTKYVLEENLTSFLMTLNPKRVKFFQVLHIARVNDSHIGDLSITKGEFLDFVKKHKVLEKYGISMAAETNEDMIGSYLMVLPDGRFFNNNKGVYHFSNHTLFDDPWLALSEARWDQEKFLSRGGIYDWNK